MVYIESNTISFILFIINLMYIMHICKKLQKKIPIFISLTYIKASHRKLLNLQHPCKVFLLAPYGRIPSM